MKKNGTNTPNATAVSLESKAGSSRDLSSWREQEIEPQFEGEQREREHQHEDPAHRQLRAALQRLLEQRHGPLGGAHREYRHADGQSHEREQDQPVVDRALCREDQRQQQDRAELADGAGAEQIGAEASAQLTGVGEDRDQRADRRRRERRARV
jgi:hypothetical protein